MTRELRDYIKKGLARGYEKSQLKDYLINYGYKEDVLDQIFEDIDSQRGFFIKFIEKRRKENAKAKNKEPEKEEGLGDPKKSLSEKIEDLTEKMDFIIEKQKLKKGKEFKLPFAIRSQLNNIAKEGKVLIIHLGTNRNISFLTKKIQDGLIEIDGKYHNCSTDFVYLLSGKHPCIVLPEWDLNPIGTKDYYKAVNDGRKVDAQAVMIRAMEAKENEAKKKMNPKMLIWIVIVAAAVFYVLYAGGK